MHGKNIVGVVLNAVQDSSYQTYYSQGYGYLDGTRVSQGFSKLAITCNFRGSIRQEAKTCAIGESSPVETRGHP